MSSQFASKTQKEADEMDAKLFAYADLAHERGWTDVARAIGLARIALLPKMHSEDRKIAANA